MTKAEVTKLIADQVEPTDTRDRVIEWAKIHQGKQLRSNNTPDGFKVRRQYGMTHLDNGAYAKEPRDWHYSMSVLIDWTESGVEVPSPEVIIERNPAYWVGRDERNHYRMELLNDAVRINALYNAINRARAAVEEYQEAKAELKEITDYPFADSSHIEKAAKIIEEKR